jgi:D-tyrosyl-tRNA(Tyr) deacylase
LEISAAHFSNDWKFGIRNLAAGRSMKLVIQRVTRASVTIDGVVRGSIDRGAVVLCGVAQDDTEADAIWLAKKTSSLRYFEDAAGKMNLAIDAVQGAFLVVSQFTLYGECEKGNRPSFITAAPPDRGNQLYELYVAELCKHGHSVETGIFGAMMQVELVNDGPVTLILESRGRTAP